MQELRKTSDVKTLEIDLCMYTGLKNVPSKGSMRSREYSSAISRSNAAVCTINEEEEEIETDAEAEEEEVEMRRRKRSLRAKKASHKSSVS